MALDGGARRIIIGCGDSGTCDGGAGALVALGARLLDAGGHEVDPIGSNLARVRRIETSGMDPRLRDVEVLVAGNMHNLLTGERGVARVFGPQKGGKDSEYPNQLVVRKDDKDNEHLKKLAKLLNDEKLRDYITKTWPNEAVIPAF